MKLTNILLALLFLTSVFNGFALFKLADVYRDDLYNLKQDLSNQIACQLGEKDYCDLINH